MVAYGHRDTVAVVEELKTAGGRERKRTIVSAAAALMYHRGVHDTAVDDVLVASGSGKSQFYHYFSGKEELVGAVLAHELETVLGDLEGFRLDTWKGIREWFDAIAQGQERRGFKGCPWARWPLS